MFKILTAAAVTLLPATKTYASDVSYEVKQDFNGYPCFLNADGGRGGGLTLQLSDYKGKWSLNFLIGNNAARVRDLYPYDGMIDFDGLIDRLNRVVLDGEEHRTHDAFAFHLRRSEVDQKSIVSVTIEGRQNVHRAINDLPADTIQIADWVTLDGYHEATVEFAECVNEVLPTTPTAPVNGWTPCTITWESAIVDGESMPLVDKRKERGEYTRFADVFVKDDRILFPYNEPEIYRSGETSSRKNHGAHFQTRMVWTVDGAASRNTYTVSLTDEGEIGEIVHYAFTGRLECEK